MPRHALGTSKEVAHLLRRRRHQLGLSLRQVQRSASAAGRPIPFSTLAKIEQGRVDPGIKRLHLLLKLYHLPMQMASDLLDLEEMADERPKVGAPQVLYEEGLEHWRRGDTRKGLAYLLALREQVPDEPEARPLRQKALLSFAIAAGSLGKYRLSLQIVEDLLLEPLDRSLLVSVLVQAGVAWNRLGSPEATLAFLGRAEVHVGAADHKQRAWILHEKARELELRGRPDLAGAVLDEALKSYRRAGDAYGECRALGVRVRLRLADGDLQGALSAARGAKRHAESHGFDRLRVSRILDEGQVLVTMGDEAAGLNVLNEGLAATLSSGDHGAQFYAHYNLWKAHERLGHQDRADVDLKAARYYVRFVDEASEEAEEIRSNLGGKERQR